MRLQISLPTFGYTDFLFNAVISSFSNSVYPAEFSFQGIREIRLPGQLTLMYTELGGVSQYRIFF